MEFELIISLISLVVALTLAVYMYRMDRRLKMLTNAVSSKLIIKVLNTLKSKRRLRKRYMVFEVLSNKRVGKGDLEHEIRNTFKKIFGDIQLARASISLTYYDENLSIGVIKFTHIYKYKVLASLGVIKNVGDTKVLIIPLRTTGSLRKALKYIKDKEQFIKH